MKSSFPLPKGGEGLMLSFDTLNSSALRFLLNQRLRALFLVDIVGPPKFWYRTVLLWLEVCSGFLNTRNWDPQLPLPGCSLKMTCRRLFVPERVVQHWHPLVWEAEKVSKVSSFWKDWARSWKTVLLVSKCKRQDATFIWERFKAQVYGKLKRCPGRGSFYIPHAVALLVNQVLSVTLHFWENNELGKSLIYLMWLLNFYDNPCIK